MLDCLACSRGVESRIRGDLVRQIARLCSSSIRYPAVFRLVDGLPLCAACLERLPLLAEPLCTVCGRELPDASAACRDCAPGQAGALVMNRAVLRYDEWTRQLIHLFKYRGDERLSTLFAAWLAIGYWRHYGDRDITLLTPVPLHDSRERQRGFNQAERLALGLSRWIRVPVATLLVRVKPTTPQIKQSGRQARLASMSGAFAVPALDSEPPPYSEPPLYSVPALPAARTRCKPMRILLVDDIYTTGATLRSCAQTLCDTQGLEGAEVYGLTVCR